MICSSHSNYRVAGRRRSSDWVRAHFTDLRSGRRHDNPNAVLAAILADATNLGIERMADASKGVTYPQLAWTHNWYLSDDNYAAALTSIIDAHHGHPFAEIWGDGTASSSDGQYFPSGRSGGGQSEINAKYGSEPGVRFYTHVSDQYGHSTSRSFPRPMPKRRMCWMG